jgi:dTDP-L-rhamnose 4-epimerase
MDEKNVLIIGGAGFIGAHTANELHRLGYNVTILDNLSPKVHNGSFPDHINNGIAKILGDVRNEDVLLPLLSKNSVIYNFASELDLNPDYSKFISVNVGGTALIYELIKKYDLCIRKVIIASTQFVYGEGKYLDSVTGREYIPSTRKRADIEDFKFDFEIDGRPLEYMFNVESQKTSPPNHYALSKYFQENFALTIGELNRIPTVILRYSIVHGPFQSLKNTYSGALRTFAIMIKNNIVIPTYEDNCSVRDFVSYQDVVSANIKVLEDTRADYQIFNVGGRRGYKVYELADFIASYFSKDLSFSNNVEYRLGDVRKSISSNDKLESLGWSSCMSLETAISDFLDWFDGQNIDIENFLITQRVMRNNGSICRIN